MNKNSKDMVQSSLNIVVAFHAEAQPLIDFYKLKRCVDIHAFEVYQNSDESIKLVISGLGKVRSAASVGFIYHASDRYNCFLNVGVAGGSNQAIGTCCLVDKVIDASTKQTWYPYVRKDFALPRLTLETHDEPQIDYQDDVLFDMEASGFIDIASKFTSTEQVCCLKIVCDNKEKPKKIDTEFFKNIIKDNLCKIDEVVQYYLKVAQTEQQLNQNPALFETITSTLHFTGFEQRELKKLLLNAHVLLEEANILNVLNSSQSSKEFLATLEQQLKSCEYTW